MRFQLQNLINQEKMSHRIKSNLRLRLLSTIVVLALMLIGHPPPAMSAADPDPAPAPYWDSPANGPNLTCQICEYKYGQCEGSEEEPCTAPVRPCHNGKQMDEVLQAVKARLHALVRPPSPSLLPRPKYICIKVEDADAPPPADKYDYVNNNMPASMGRGGGGRGGFVDEYGDQSPQVINMAGRPGVRIGAGGGIPDEPGVAGVSGPGFGGGGGGDSEENPNQPISPYLAASARARQALLKGQSPDQLAAATPSPACDESTANNEACDPGAAAAGGTDGGGGVAQSNLSPNAGGGDGAAVPQINNQNLLLSAITVWGIGVIIKSYLAYLP